MPERAKITELRTEAIKRPWSERPADAGAEIIDLEVRRLLRSLPILSPPPSIRQNVYSIIRFNPHNPDGAA